MGQAVRLFCALGVWGLTVAAVGCQTLGLSPPTNKLLPDAKEISSTAPVPAPVPRELAKELQPSYIVEPNDVLLVQPADLDAPLRLPPDQTVFADGTIDLGTYGRVLVAGKTQEQIASEVAAVVNAKEKPEKPIAITVRIIGRNTKVYYVLGEVNAPGAFPVNGFDTALDGIIKAGGLSRRAGKQNIILSRPTPPDGCRVVYPVCYPQIVQLGDTSTNYQLQPGDRIYVPSQGLFEGLFHNRCRRGGPCCRPQVGCWNLAGGCATRGGCATPAGGPAHLSVFPPPAATGPRPMLGVTAPVVVVPPAPPGPPSPPSPPPFPISVLPPPTPLPAPAAPPTSPPTSPISVLPPQVPISAPAPGTLAIPPVPGPFER